jgi:hypothetical protein
MLSALVVLLSLTVAVLVPPLLLALFVQKIAGNGMRARAANDRYCRRVARALPTTR